MEKGTFKPYIPAEKTPLELTAVSVVVGMLLAILFGGANAYLGLRVYSSSRYFNGCYSCPVEA